MRMCGGDRRNSSRETTSLDWALGYNSRAFFSFSGVTSMLTYRPKRTAGTLSRMRCRFFSWSFTSALSGYKSSACTPGIGFSRISEIMGIRKASVLPLPVPLATTTLRPARSLRIAAS